MITPSALLFLFFCAFVCFGIGIAGIWHSRTSRRGAQITLWIFAGTGALIVFLIGHGSGFVMVLLLPIVVLAILACLFSLGHGKTSA